MSNDPNSKVRRALSINEGGQKASTQGEGVTTVLQGGTIRHQRGGKQEERVFNEGPGPKPEPSVKVHSGAYRALIGSDGSPVSVSLGDAKYRPSDDRGPGGILENARTRSGQRVTSVEEVTDQTEVIVNGVSMEAWAAARAGLLVRHADGSYHLPGEVDPSTVDRDAVTKSETGEERAQNEEPSEVNHLSPELRETLDGLDEITGSPHASEAIVAKAIVHQVDGDAEKAALELVRATGMDAGEAAQLVQDAYDDAYATAAAHLSEAYGVNGAEVFEHLGKTMPKEARASLAYRIYLGDKTAFQEAVDRFKRAKLVEEHSSKK